MHDLERKQLARIHCLKKELVLDDPGYRALLRELTGVESSKHLSAAQRALLIGHLQAMVNAKPKPAAPPHQPQVRKIEALLRAAGRDGNYLYAKGSKPESLFERLTGKRHPRFCTSRELGRVIAALEIDQRRREARSA